MVNFSRVFVLLVGGTILAGCAASGPSITTAVRPGAAVPAPTYRSGDQWAYQVSRSNGDNEQMRITYRNGRFESDNPTVFNSSLWSNVYRADGELKPLAFPLASGKSWSYRYEGTSRRGRTMSRDAEVKVIGPTVQPITTKAGQFKAVEIQRIETWGAAERKTTYFYSPETRSVVKLVSDIASPTGSQHYELELIKYNGGR